MIFWNNKARNRPRRVYAIGDVHGRLDLFKRLIGVIKRDNAARSVVPTRIVLLGDLIDHGPDSATLVRYCKLLSEQTDRFQVLKGDHEAMMVAALRHGDDAAINRWLDHGGQATLASWGVDEHAISRSDRAEFLVAARCLVGEDTLSWMDSLPLSSRHENYLFVHAGVRPGVAFKKQVEHDLLTIRGDFLRSKADHGAMVVHGHSVHESGPDMQPNRIGIDSGAYRTGRLSAVGIEDGQVWPMMTEPDRSDRPRATTEAELNDVLAGLRIVR